MPWVAMDDQYPERAEVAQIGAHAAWLNVCAWAYCNRQLTDGFVPAGVAGRLADVPKVAAQIAALVAVGWWMPVEGGYEIVGYLRYQKSAAEIRAKRENDRRRQAKSRAGSRSASHRDTEPTSAGRPEAPTPNPPTHDLQPLATSTKAPCDTTPIVGPGAVASFADAARRNRSAS